MLTLALQKLRMIIIFMASAILIAVCGGSGSGEDFVDKYNSFIDEFDNRFDITGTPQVTEYDDLPAVGSADYEGFIVVNQIIETIRAEADLTANFGAGTITMTTSNYNKFDSSNVFDGSTSGNLSMTNGVISEDGVGDALITGSVNGSADGTNYTGTNLVGGFLGANGDGVLIGSPTLGNIPPTIVVFAATN